ncbi:mgtA regulatory leader peptide MgtL [Kosakonia sp. ML.JS2a]
MDPDPTPLPRRRNYR